MYLTHVYLIGMEEVKYNYDFYSKQVLLCSYFMNFRIPLP